VLGVIGARILAPIPENERIRGLARRRRGFVIAVAALIGLFAGLLANGGGFLLVPLYVVVLGLTMPESAGTSLVVIAVLAVPTFLSHWLLGHIRWSIAGPFTLGAVPGALVGTIVTRHAQSDRLRMAFGCLLLAFAAYFVIHQVQ
jgi:uncharacterized protein